MRKMVLSLVLLGLLFLSPLANANGKLDFGGKLDDGDLFLLTSLDYSWPAESEHLERDIKFNYRYQDKSDRTTTNKGLLQFKQRYEFAKKHYVFGLGRYDYNEFRSIHTRFQASAGWGYKILRTDKIKMSNELAIGMLHTNEGDEVIYRNSLWFFYNLAEKLTFSNKYLYEGSNIPLTRMESELSYQLLDNTKIGIKNIYTEDPISDNIISFNVGYTW